MDQPDLPIHVDWDAVHQSILASLEEKTPRKTILKAMTEHGVPEDQAREILYLVSEEFTLNKQASRRRRRVRKMGIGMMLVGGSCIGAGLAYTIVSYLDALKSGAGGIYSVAYGLIGLGVLIFISGLDSFLRPDNNNVASTIEDLLGF